MPNDDQTVLFREPSCGVGRGTRSTGATLTPQQLAMSRSRLGFLTLLFAALCLLAFVIDRTMYRHSEYPLYPVYVFNGITSVLLYLSTRIKGLLDKTILKLGLVYEVLMCLSVSVGFTWVEYMETGAPPAVTWVCIVMVTFPLIIPTSPKLTFWSALAAAAMVPFGLFLIELAGQASPTAFDYVDVSISPAFCILIAVLGSRVIYGLNVEVARAQRMGSYQLVDLIGRGGMGEVWRAEHRLLARPAAVKLVRPEVRGSYSPAMSERLMEKFKREAEVTAGLESPYTVRLYDFGVTDAGAFYYVMELLDGLDLEKLVLSHGPLPPERAVHVLLQVCHSLREAHDQGLIHRDIKPANLVLCRSRAGDSDVVKVLDFGLVALRHDAHADDAQLTVDGQIGGTPAYMPPEQATQETVDARTDIYAVGCVAYWLLAGRPVFEAENPMKTILAHLHDDPVPPSQRAGVDVPPELERLVMECLEKAPDRRPQSVEDVASRLRASGLAADWTQGAAASWWELHPGGTVDGESEDVTVQLG